MIKPVMKRKELKEYCFMHIEMANKAVANLETSWEHGGIIRDILKEEVEYLKMLIESDGLSNIYDSVNALPDRKTEKYTEWPEVMRLAFFQYEKFTTRKKATSEGLYATLLALAQIWGNSERYENIVVLGCGPGRSVLDFARAYPKAQVKGLDYSLLSLIIADKIICSKGGQTILRRDVHSSNLISEKLFVQGFGLTNVELLLGDMIKDKCPKGDLVICSNTINLLPDHSAAVRSLVESINQDGILIYADLVGWRIDRNKERTILQNDEAIRKEFESVGMTTLDSFSGVPYIETESDDQRCIYDEHIYVGVKKS